MTYSLTRACALTALALAAAAHAQDTLITAGRMIVAPGVETDAAALLIRGGEIAALGDEIPGDARSSATRVAYDGAVLMAGLVSVHGYLDQQGDLAETVDAVTPDLRSADAFDPFGEALAKLGPQGLTSYGLAPYSANTFAGIAAAVKPGTARGRVLDGDAYLKLALVDTARTDQRYPTSLMGAVDLCRLVFDTARDASVSGADVAVVREALDGSRILAIHANTASELGRALDLAERYQFRPVLLGAAQAGDMIERIVEAEASLVLAPLTLDSKQEALELPAKLAARGVRFSFVGDAARMRWSAALAARHGLGRDAAIAALTRTPAEQLGVADHVGSLRANHDADVVVFSGDPLDLSSHLLAVYADGALLTSEIAR